MTVEVQPRDEHNETLLESVHPPDWVNPDPAPSYNLVVIGGGTAGLVSAAGAAGLGAKVALCEKDLLGGDCLNRGCVPSKALLRASRAVQDVRDADRFGVEVPDPDGVRVDFGAVMERMRRLRARIAEHDAAARFRDLGVDVFLGEARFAGPRSVVCGDVTLAFSKAVIATGARAFVPPIPGLEEAGYLTNETIFERTELPERLAIAGAGPIGCEMAQAFQRFGSRVSLVEMMPRILTREDRDAARRVEDALVADGVELLCGLKLVEVETTDDGSKVLSLEPEEGETRTLEVDEILMGVGRRPNVTGLGLDEAGVAFDERTGIEVTDRLQTTNSSIWAAGDCCFRHQFTHAADALARIVLRNALFPFGREKASALTIPWCTYTDPEIAHVGMDPDDAEEAGVAIDTFTVELSEVDRAILDGEEDGFLEVHVRAGTDEIVGATLVARHAGETISEITAAMVGGVGLGTLASTIHPYPTQAECIKKAADAWQRTRLTPFVKSMMERWLAFRR